MERRPSGACIGLYLLKSSPYTEEATGDSC